MSLQPVLAGAALAVMLTASTVGAADLSSAKALYASASYEEALTMLSSLESTESLEQVNQIRALCLLALGRSVEAEKAVERIVMHNPAYMLEFADVSPKLVTLFHDVRRRALPTAARLVYVDAKSSYDEKQWVDAKRQFGTLLGLINDPDVADQQSALADLRQLGEGFLKLSEVEIAAAEAKKAAEDAKVAAPPPPAEPASSSTAAPSTAAAAEPVRPAAPEGQTVFTALDRNVTPPVEQRRVMPRWSPNNRAMAVLAHSGLLEIVIDQSGGIESASMAKSVLPGYDEALLQAARSWRYKPAEKDGKPVRYRQVLEIVLRPSQ